MNTSKQTLPDPHNDVVVNKVTFYCRPCESTKCEHVQALRRSCRVCLTCEFWDTSLQNPGDGKCLLEHPRAMESSWDDHCPNHSLPEED